MLNGQAANAKLLALRDYGDSLLFGFLASGSTAMQRSIGVSASFADIVQGIIIIFVAVAAVSQVKKSKKPIKKPDSKKPVLKEAKQ